jgi:hypothetical protein
VNPKGSHVCLLTVDQSLAATAKFPHIQTDPQHKHLLAMLPDQYAGLRNVKTVTRFATMTRLGCSLSRISYSEYVVSSEIGFDGLLANSLKVIIMVICPMNRQLTL